MFFSVCLEMNILWCFFIIGIKLCNIVIVFFGVGFFILMIWNWWVSVVFFLKNFLYLVYVVVVIVLSLLCVSVGFNRFVVLFWLVWLLLLIIVCVLLINKIIGVGVFLIFDIKDFSLFLNLFFILVLVCNKVRFRVWIFIFFKIFGILFWVIFSVNFLIIVVLLIFVLLVRIGLFCLCWVRILIICLILKLCFKIGFIFFVFVWVVKLIVNWFKLGVLEFLDIDFLVWFFVIEFCFCDLVIILG